MRFIAPLAVIAALSTGVWCGGAQAMPLMPLTALSVFGAPSTAAPLLERVTNVCGISGCAPVWTKRIQKPPAGFVQRAAPMVVQTNQHVNAAPLAPTK